MPLTDGVAYADKWLSLSDPGQLFVVGAAMRSRGELALADELEPNARIREEAGSGACLKIHACWPSTGVPEFRSVVAKLDRFLRKRTESLRNAATK